ncbi:MAG: long-chain-fatty-acid--CoA ligase [Thermodesulfobacteriota bacterium]
MVLGELVDRNARKYPDKTAVIFGPHRFSFAQFRERVNRLANALLGSGLTKEDRLAILAKNCHQYMEIFFAAAKAGLVVVPLNHRLLGGEIAHIVNHAQAKLFLFQSNYTGLIRSITPELRLVKEYVSLGPEVEGYQDYESLLASYSGDDPGVEVTEEDMICIMYTSGTTGSPKGAVMTQSNWLAHTVNMIIELKISSHDRTLHVIPFFHIASTWPMLTHFYMGATNVILESFEPNAVLETFERGRITTCNLVPSMIIQLLESDELPRHDYSGLKWLGYGASPMPLEVLRKAISAFGPKLLQVYGLTEANPLLTLLPVEEHVLEGEEKLVRRLTSCGRQLINVDVRVVDDSGALVKPGQVGEIIARGDSIIREYWRMPEETRRTIKDGWLYSGDLATVDEDGYIYIVDRKKDIIISGGENISSREVEEAIYCHPAVLEAAVMAVPDDHLVEAVKAVVVLKKGQQASEEEIIALCRQKLAGYKRPRSVDFVDSLPKGASGKILKRELRERYWKDQPRRV